MGRHQRGGCAGLLRCGKGTTYEGGMRVPALISWPGKIRPGVSRYLMATIDILPTLLNMVTSTVDMVPIVAGVDQSDLILGNEVSNFCIQKKWLFL